MTKSISFLISLSKEEVEKIVRQHIIDTYDPQDEDFKHASEFEDENYYWDVNDEKEFCRIDLMVTSQLRAPSKKSK